MRRFISITLLTFLLILAGSMTSFAANEEQPTSEQANDLSLEEVIELSLTKSTSIEKAEKDVDRAWEVRKALRGGYISGLANTPSTGDLYTSVPGADDYLFRFLSANGQWTINKKMLDLTKDAVVLQAKGNYYDVMKKLQELDTAKLSVQNAEADYKIAMARATVGMASDVEVKAAKSLLEMENSTLEQAQAELENAYRTLNKLIGFKPDERPDLTTSIEFEKIEAPVLENKVVWALSPDNNPYLWSKKEGYEISKYTWTFTEPDEAGLIDKEKAQLTYQDARKDTRDKVYELYDNLKTLEASYKSAEEGVNAAAEALRVTQLMYEVGMVTNNSVLEKEVDLANARGGLLKVKSLYELTKETFEKPWLAFVGSGATDNNE